MAAKKKKPVSRPRKEFDLEEVRKLALMQSTDEEIANFFECCIKTFQNARRRDPDLQAALDHGRGNGKASLRRMQWKSAQGGSVPMQIHLGKVYLGQHETHNHNHSGEVTTYVQPYKPRNGRGA